MRRLLYVAALAMLTMLVLAPAAMAQDVDCPQLTFEEAQDILAADPSDPNGLDRDKDGTACDRSNTLPSQPQPMMEETMMEQTPPMKAEPKMEQPKMEQPKMESTTPKDLPNTGGTATGSAFLLPAGALLVGSGILALGMLRRS